MKKILYSAYTKFIAGAIIVILAFFGVYNAAMTLNKCFTSELGFLYDSVSILDDSSCFSEYIGEPENYLVNAYSEFEKEFDEAAYKAKTNSALTIPDIAKITVFKEETISKEKLRFDAIKEKLIRTLSEYNGRINYFVSINGKIISNCDVATADELINPDFPYMYAHRTPDGRIVRDINGNFYGRFCLQDLDAFENTDDIVVCTAITEDFYHYCWSEWSNQQWNINNTFLQLAAFVITAFILFVYLLAVSGKNADGTCKSIWLDRVWTEIHIAVTDGAIILGIVAVTVILKEFWYAGSVFYMASITASFVFAFATLVTVLFSMSVARKFRCRCFLKTTLVCILFNKLLKALKTMLALKTSVYLALMLLIYTAIIGICGIFTFEAAVFFFAAVALYIAVACAVVYRAKAFDEIRKGAREVSGGNLSYKIPEQAGTDMRELAENINGIAGGLDKSVEAKIKAERMKTELITNVSHDIKTPLTSIINYTELLSGIENLPDEARDYISIISAKSDRLKQLTSDLFDISKVQSGNEVINHERLDVSLLISQSLAEYDKEMHEASLCVVSELDKSLEIVADGRKMSRVIGNLLGNIIKYSLSGTRVFVTAEEIDGSVVIELKNISAYPLDFSAEEITERFVRGEESRSAEGNGLGLAIARSYTEACGGKFNISLDGDLFKAIITFDKAN